MRYTMTVFSLKYEGNSAYRGDLLNNTESKQVENKIGTVKDKTLVEKNETASVMDEILTTNLEVKRKFQEIDYRWIEGLGISRVPFFFDSVG